MDIKERLSSEKTASFTCSHCTEENATIKSYVSILKCPVVLYSCNSDCEKSKIDELIHNEQLFCSICFKSILNETTAYLSKEEFSKERQLLCLDCSTRLSPSICCATLHDNLYEHSPEIRTVYFRTAELPEVVLHGADKHVTAKFKNSRTDFVKNVRCCTEEACCPIKHIRVWTNGKNKARCFECFKVVNTNTDKIMVAGQFLGNDYLCCSKECGDKITSKFWFERCTVCDQYGTFKCTSCINNPDCKDIYYCSRKCQVDDYRDHKTVCRVVSK
jgi:hypothetical protein